MPLSAVQNYIAFNIRKINEWKQCGNKLSCPNLSGETYKSYEQCVMTLTPPAETQNFNLLNKVKKSKIHPRTDPECPEEE